MSQSIKSPSPDDVEEPQNNQYHYYNVPYFYLHHTSLIETALRKTLSDYDNDVSTIIKRLSREHAKILDTERALDLLKQKQQPSAVSRSFEKKIHNLTRIFEHDRVVLDRLMSDLPIVKSLMDDDNNNNGGGGASSSTLSDDDEMIKKTTTSSSIPTGGVEEDDGDKEKKNDDVIFVGRSEHIFVMRDGVASSSGARRHSSSSLSTSSSAGYDSPGTIFVHITRDWSEWGSNVRKSLYDWCTGQLLSHHSNDNNINGRRQQQQQRQQQQRTVLVPGAGMGRLAADIFNLGCYTVEANDASIVMAAASHHFLNSDVKGAVHPFAFDYFTNEVNSTRRFDHVNFDNGGSRPKTNVREGGNNSLSYTIGDFVYAYTSQRQENKYDAVVTSFFIDTASNIYEYLTVIKYVLKRGGVWINTGPLQWHQNSLLKLTADELKAVIEDMGFTIKTWTVDEEGVNYRHDENIIRYTKVEMYKPLRFVVTLNEDTYDFDAFDLILDIRENTSKQSIIGTRGDI